MRKIVKEFAVLYGRNSGGKKSKTFEDGSVLKEARARFVSCSQKQCRQRSQRVPRAEFEQRSGQASIGGRKGPGSNPGGGEYFSISILFFLSTSFILFFLYRVLLFLFNFKNYLRAPRCVVIFKTNFNYLYHFGVLLLVLGGYIWGSGA